MTLPEAIPSFVLASGSPRRKELLAQAGLRFTTHHVDVDESFTPGLTPLQVVDQLAHRKLMACNDLRASNLVITADTLVYKGKEILGKPQNPEQAREMLNLLSGDKHQVTTSVCLGYGEHFYQFKTTTIVYFEPLTKEMINYYIDNYQPFDKAGSYGIQEWLGLIGIQKIDGSYSNVVGLPVSETFQALVMAHNEWHYAR